MKTPFSLFAMALLAALFASCARPGTEASSPSSSPEAVSENTYPWKPWALLKTGEHPLWFELSGDGPRLISSPGEASLSPYLPWRLARHIVGLGVWEDHLVMIVNREGFFVLSPGPGETALGLVSDSANWDPYTVASFFFYQDNPAALLYRDDFFVESAAPVPSPRLFTLAKGEDRPSALAIPALEALPASLGWDVDTLRYTKGFWYYRGVKKSSGNLASPQETAIFRTGDLALPGEKISLGSFRNSALPESLEEAPPLLARLLAGVFEDPPLEESLGHAEKMASVFSGEFSGKRFFSSGFAASQSAEGKILIFPGFYREFPPGTVPSALALALQPWGPGAFGLTRQAGDEAELQPFTLPPLPEDFVYTGVAFLEGIIAASWEEQQDSAIGAAGFMVMEMKIDLF
jgi:hypothetical protein